MNSEKRVVGVIPARYGSTRLVAKALAMIHGKPMIQWVYENAKKSKHLTDLIVATDHDLILKAVQEFGGRAFMTSVAIQSGTDRVAAVAEHVPGDIYVNIQGDEPLLLAKSIDVAIELVLNQGFEMGTIMTPLRSPTELDDQACVKVIADQTGRAVYFSRLPIPYSRGERPLQVEQFVCQRHLGLYVFQKQALFKFRDLPPSALERAEVLEQLRAIQAGMKIGIATVPDFAMGVDTLEDLEQVRIMLKN